MAWPRRPGDPITLSCEQLGIPAEYCEADKVDVDLLRQMLVAGPLTGAAMNPARYLGPAIMGGGLQDVWLYWLGPLLGGIAAAFVYSGALLEH